MLAQDTCGFMAMDCAVKMSLVEHIEMTAGVVVEMPRILSKLLGWL